MSKVTIKNTKVINASEDKAWGIVSDQFADVYKFAGGVTASEANTDIKKRFEDAPAAGRICDVRGFGKMKEEILHYDSSKREITWDAAGEKIPGFVSTIQNAVSVTQVENGKALVTSNVSINLNGFLGFVMRPVIKNTFDKAIKGFLKDLAVYAETGDISESKKENNLVKYGSA